MTINCIIICSMHWKTWRVVDKTGYENQCEHVREEVTNTTDAGKYDDKDVDTNSIPTAN